MNPNGGYLGEAIVRNYLSGPGMLQRSFHRYAVDKDLAGLPTLSVRSASNIDPLAVKPFIPLAGTPTGLVTNMEKAQILDGDFAIWAEQYIWVNYPSLINTDWVSDYNDDTNEITIQFISGSVVVFTPVDYSKDDRYVAAWYNQSVPAEVQTTVTGTTTTNSSTPPVTTGFALQSSVVAGSPTTYPLTKTVTETKVYSNGDPTVVTTTYPVVNEDFSTIDNTYTKNEYLGGAGTTVETTTRLSTLYETIYKKTLTESVGVDVVVVNDLGGGETETVTTNTSGEYLAPAYTFRMDTLDTVQDKIINGTQIWIYKIGTGNATLDALAGSVTPVVTPEYFPFIPLRIKNKSLNNTIYSDAPTGSGLYTESVKAYKKASKGQKLQKLIDEVEDNPDIGDIDYCYIQWGTPVNVLDNSSRKYMYEWFRNLIAIQSTSISEMAGIKDAVAAYEAQKTALAEWKAGQTNSLSALFGLVKPTLPNLPTPKSTTVRLRSDHPQLGGFDNRFTWVSIQEETGFTGDAKAPGTVWWSFGENFTWSEISGTSGSILDNRELNEVFLYKQTGATTYSRLKIWGMVHENYIYGGKAVRTTLKAGMQDTSESVFLVPLHAPTVKSLGIKDFTQMSLSNTFLTFNSYEVVKKKWYQTFLGMLLIVIAIVIIAVLINPVAVANAVGVFGSAATVGAGLGLSGTAAIIAGAVTNAIAAIVIANVISAVSVEIFGEKWGSIIGAIVNFAVSFGMANGFQAFDMAKLITPQNILAMSNALANGYQGYAMSELYDLQKDREKAKEEYDLATRTLEQYWVQNGLVNNLSFDALTLTDSVKGNDGSSGSYSPESLDTFINRTLIMGDQVAEASLAPITNFAELQLTLPKG